MDRRAFLTGTAAGSVLWALGCRGAPVARPVALENRGEVRSWLHDAVARVAAAMPAAHVQALATTRWRVTAAVDVLGDGVSRARADGVVIVVRDATGAFREQVSSELTQAGVAAAAATLAGKSAAAPNGLEFGAPQVAPPLTGVDPRGISDAELILRVRRMLGSDPEVSSRIVYTVASIDVDDAHVWSVAAAPVRPPDRRHGAASPTRPPIVDREQRLVRVRRAVTRVAWNGTRPVVSEASRGWTGGLDDGTLPLADISAATDAALELMTPGAFTDGARAVSLDPSVTALVVDTATRALLTGAAARLPEVARRLAVGAAVASPLLTLVDDPTAAGAYGGFHFDDEGVAAAPVILLDRGVLAGRLDDRATGAGGRGRRPGHVGRVEPWPSHLELAPGVARLDGLLADGIELAGGVDAVLDPSSDRIVVSVARAYEIQGGHRTGRVFADVELVGDLAELLAGVSAVASEPRTFARRDEVDGLPRWRSIATPGVVTHGLVRARRRVA
jgi:hypothetical protein|nr:metallopeptidase TldD-related protein [Kofleriaceae bacterium]